MTRTFKLLTAFVLMLALTVAVSAEEPSDNAAASAAQPVELPHPPTFNSFDAAAAAAGDRPILIDFYTDWCIWCKRLDSNVFSQPQVIEYFTDKVLLAKVNAEVDTMLAQKYKVSGYPTAVLVKADGSEIDRVIGYAEADEYVKTVDDYQNGIGTLDDLLAQAAARVDRELYFKIADKYKYRGAPEQAAEWFDKVVDAGQPTDSLTGEARMSLADMHRRAKEYDQALKIYASIEKEFAGQIFEEWAVIWQAIVYSQSDQTQKAIDKYRDFIKRFPSSEDVEYANKQIEKLGAPSEGN